MVTCLQQDQYFSLSKIERIRNCFFKVPYQCTHNQDGVFNHYWIALCYDFPQQINLVSLRRINILVPPPTIKYDSFIFNPDLQKDHYIQIGFKQKVFESWDPKIHSPSHYLQSFSVASLIDKCENNNYYPLAMFINGISKNYNIIL